MPAFLTDLLNIFASLCKIRLYPQSLRIQAVLFYVDPCWDQRNNLRSDLVKLYICLKQIIINYGN